MYVFGVYRSFVWFMPLLAVAGFLRLLLSAIVVTQDRNVVKESDSDSRDAHHYAKCTVFIKKQSLWKSLVK